ncbi:MAG: ribonuclease P protein component [Candidatus Pacebacteria bacterium]|nr:ribonuclease P protein component [Candidatus Paceibacterota bacterium]
MFSRPMRLSREAIASISGDPAAKRATSEHFSVVFSTNDRAAASGCAVVVSKKISKTSVRRHLLKRRIRAALKEWCSRDYVLIVYARAGSSSLPYSAIAEELSRLLPRAGAYRTM